MKSGRILLILMRASTSFKANKQRTKAAIDERLMKGFPDNTFPAVGHEDNPFGVSPQGRQLARPKRHSRLRLTYTPQTSPASVAEKQYARILGDGPDCERCF
jgi:hypothetical protein